MAYFFTFVFLVAVIALLLGIIKPKLVIKWKKEPTRLDVIKTYLSLAFISFVLAGIFIPKDNLKTKNQQTLSKDIKQDNKKEISNEEKDFIKDKETMLKLLNMSYHDIKYAEKNFKTFQNYLENNDMYSAIQFAKKNQYKIFNRSYPDDFESDKNEDKADKYIETVDKSFTFLQIYYGKFLDYIDDPKPTKAVEVKEYLQTYQTYTTQAIAQAFEIASSFKINFDDYTETWREKKYIDEDRQKLKEAQLIQKKHKPFIKIKNLKKGTPKYVLGEFINAWQYKNYEKMVRFTQKSWRERQSSPKGDLFNTFNDKTLTYAKILKIQKNSSNLVRSIVKIKYLTWDKKEKTAIIHPNIIKEDGEYGVNPISAIRED